MFDNDFLNQLRSELMFRTDIYYGLLFHGSRRYSFECPKEEREALYNASKIVNTFADNLLNSGYLDWQKINEYNAIRKKNKLPAYFGWITVPKGKKTTDRLFQYGDLYVSNDFEYVVENFCDVPGGEYTQIAYCNAVGLKDFKVEVPDEVKQAMEYIEKEYPKHANSERIVVAISHVEFEDLLTEEGNKVHINEEDFGSFFKHRHNFRIVNFEKYRNQIVIIPELSFKEVNKAIRESKTKL